MPTRQELQDYWTTNAAGFSPANQAEIIKKMKTFHSAVPIIPDEIAFLQDKASAITGKYSNEPVRYGFLNSAQIHGKPILLDNIRQAYEEIEKHRNTIRFLEDAVSLGRVVIAIREREEMVSRTASAEDVMAGFLAHFVLGLDLDI